MNVHGVNHADDQERLLDTGHEGSSQYKSVSADNVRPFKRRKHNAASPDVYSQYRETGLMRRGGREDSASFIGSASGAYFARSVNDALQNGSSADIIPGEDDQLVKAVQSSIARLWDSSEISNPSTILATELQWLADDYFDHWHTAFPVIYAPSILRAFELIAGAPLSQAIHNVDHLDLIIVRAIMSISAADRRQCAKVGGKAVPSGLLFQSYDQAIECVQAALKLPASCRSLQAVLAVQLFLISMLRYNAAMRIGGIAVRLAFQLGLHRCPYRYASFTDDHEAQMRKRIFWTAYCLDRMLCQSLGLPLGMRDDDIDVCLFAHEKHRSTVQTSLEPNMAQLHFLVKHAETKGMIIEYCNKNIDQRSADIRIRQGIEESMARNANELDDFFELNAESVFVHKAQKCAIQVLQHECTIALNRPLLAIPKDNKEYVMALQTCISAARSSINTLHAILLAHLSKYASYDRDRVLTPLFWPSFTWLTWMSAFIVLYAATNDELPIEVAEHIDILEHLSLRGTIWPQRCTLAIKQLLERLSATKPARTRHASNHDGLNGYNIGTSGAATSSPSDELPMLSEEYMFSVPIDATQHDPAPDSAMPGVMGLFDGFDIPFWMGDDQYTGWNDLATW